jgi:branched-chain amino acid transport system permease protein
MGQTLVYGILNGALYGIIALGIALVFGIMKYLNVAHGSLIVVGAYGSLFLFRLGLDPFASIPIILIMLFIGGAILYRAFFGRLIALPEGDKINDSLLIGFGLMLVLDNLSTFLFTGDERSMTPTYSGMTFELFGLRLPLIGLAGGLLALLLILALHLFLSGTYFGKSVLAVSQDHEAASLMGINIRRTFLISFAISVSLASIPSILIGLQSFSPTAGIQWFNKGIIVVMLSGIGNIYGVFPAGLFLGIIEALSVFLFGAAYREVTGLAVFVLILILSPKGLLGRGAEA